VRSTQCNLAEKKKHWERGKRIIYKCASVLQQSKDEILLTIHLEKVITRAEKAAFRSE
jgi:hypothetical protein